MHKSLVKSALAHTVRCCFNADNFVQYLHNRHPIASPLIGSMGVCCVLAHAHNYKLKWTADMAAPKNVNAHGIRQAKKDGFWPSCSDRDPIKSNLVILIISSSRWMKKKKKTIISKWMKMIDVISVTSNHETCCTNVCILRLQPH